MPYSSKVFMFNKDTNVRMFAKLSKNGNMATLGLRHPDSMYGITVPFNKLERAEALDNFYTHAKEEGGFDSRQISVFIELFKKVAK